MFHFSQGLEGEDDTGEGLSAALLWVLDFVESEEYSGDTRPKYWAIRCLLDALVSEMRGCRRHFKGSFFLWWRCTF